MLSPITYLLSFVCVYKFFSGVLCVSAVNNLTWSMNVYNSRITVVASDTSMKKTILYVGAAFHSLNTSWFLKVIQ